jgi:hypothetical protein
MNLRENYEGVDLYWPGQKMDEHVEGEDKPTAVTMDGHLDSVTCFGKMWIAPYPFHLVG